MSSLTLAAAANTRSTSLLRNSVMGATGATGMPMPSASTGITEPPSATGAVAAAPTHQQDAKWLNSIHNTIDDLKTFSDKKNQERDSICQKEFKSIKDEQAQEEKDEKDERASQKQNLADALDARIKGMGQALNKLVGLQKQLKGHIDNVNLIFQAKYAQDQRDMEVAGEAFESLMKHATAGNPKDKPIKVPLMPALNMSFVETGLSTGIYSERLSNMKARLARHMASGIDDLPQCSDAHQAALGLFHKGARYHEEIKQFFAAERKVLASFREQLANVLRSKLAKMAKLKAQSAKLKNALKTPEVDMKKALGEALAAHEEIVHAACAQMDAHAQSNGPKRKMLIEKANQCAKNTGNGAGVRLGNNTETLADKVHEVEEVVAETTKETGGTVSNVTEPVAEEPVVPVIVEKVVEHVEEKHGNVITV